MAAAVYLAAALVLGAWMAFGCGLAPEPNPKTPEQINEVRWNTRDAR